MEISQTSSTKQPFLLYNPLSWVFAVWGSVQILLLLHYGIMTEMEAEKYIHEAQHFLETGTVSTSNYWLYSTQIFLIALAIKLHTGLVSVYLVQLFFSGLSIFYFYRFVARNSNIPTAAIVTLLLATNIPFQTFNCQLQTESLFFSLTILFSCYLLSLKKLDLITSVKIFLFLVLILFTRPTGMLFLPCTGLYLFFRFFSVMSTLLKTTLVILLSVIFLYALDKALGSGGGLDFMLPFRDERIICGVPTTPGFLPIKTTDNPNSISGLLYYITHNTGQFTRLAWIKTKAFFGVARPYYSTGHNIFLGALYYPLYILFILSVADWWKQKRNILLYCASLILITWLCVIMTCDDWHNRFYLSIIPYFYMLSIPAVKKITKKLFPNASSNADFKPRPF